ncbi:MAG: pilin [bacterium]
MQKTQKVLAWTAGFAIVALPFVVSASGLVPDCNIGKTPNAGNTGLGTPCDFNQLITLINNVIRFLLFVIATPLAALCIAWAGILMISPGSEEKATKAKHIVTNLVIGYIIALAAWLIVTTILSSLGFVPDPRFNFLGLTKS